MREREREIISLTKHPNESAHHNEGAEGEDNPAKPVCLPRGASRDLLVYYCIKPTVSIM